MASICRSAITTASRSMIFRSTNTIQKTLNPKAFSSSSSRVLPRASRIVSVLGSAESMIPLHTVVASSRLKSSLAVDSSCWSWLSQGFATPL